jgi:hypothetical protein
VVQRNATAVMPTSHVRRAKPRSRTLHRPTEGALACAPPVNDYATPAGGPRVASRAVSCKPR